MGWFGRKSEFYDWQRGAQHWRYTTDDSPVIYQQQTYVPVRGMKRGAFSESAEPNKNALDVTVPIALPLLDMFRGRTPMEPILLSVYERKRDSTVVRRWVGEVGGVKFNDKAANAVLHHLPPNASLRMNGLKRCWQKSCPHMIYSAGDGLCNAPREAMRVDATVTAVTGNVVRSATWAGKPDGWFDGGWVQWNEGTATERRFIVSHVGDTLTLLTPALLAVGRVVATYPGCDGTWDTCINKFNNWKNYGGQPWIPIKNPMGGESIY
jgi:uncharacterized phage protein (TIGR02218 family)